MINRRALTMIETLAATVLLAVLAAACLPAVQGALRQLQVAPADRVSIAQLGRFADEFLAISETEAILADFSHGVIYSPALEADVEVTRMQARGPTDHAWLKFACDEAIVLRWIPARLAPESAGAAP